MLTSLSRRGRQGSQPPTYQTSRLRQSIEEGPAGFSTCGASHPHSGPVYRGGAGRVLNHGGCPRAQHASLSRRGRQGSQRGRCATCIRHQSIEEGPAGFSTVPVIASTASPVYRGGAGRVLNNCSCCGAGFASLSRRGRQGSQRRRQRVLAASQSIEEGPAGFSTTRSTPAACAPVYRGGAGRVLNRRSSDTRSRTSLSRRGRQGSQQQVPS